MKRLVVSVLCLGVLGCTSPKTLRPIAVQNRENIQNYSHNNRRLHAITKKLLILRLDIELTKYRKQVEDDVVTGYGDAFDPNKLKPELEKIHEMIKAVNSLSARVSEADQAQLASKKKELEILKWEHPVAYDVTIGKFAEATAVLDNKQINAAYSNHTDPDTQLRIVNPLLDKYTLVADYREGRQALLDAYERYLTKLDEQGRIAGRHAEALVFFTEERFDVGNAILQTIDDVEVQGSILEIVRDAHGEEKSRKAKVVLETIFGTLAESQ